ncbi:MAG: glycosyltransferase [Ignavibacteria bacterium]|nr:glycosyltransferase [Ignavibacteria bacterium]
MVQVVSAGICRRQTGGSGNRKSIEGNITWKRGSSGGAGMIVRKTALKKLYSRGFKSMMSDRKGNELSSGGDSELGFALVLSGWQVWYDTRLKLKHCMPAGRVTWNYLIRLFQGFGITSVGLDHYEKAIKAGRADTTPDEVNKENWKFEYKKTLKEIRKYGLKRILSLRFSQDNNTQIPMLEYHISSLKELCRVKKEYDKDTDAIKNAVWRADNKVLKVSHRKFIETENDFRYGWPWRDETRSKTLNLKKYPKISILSPSFNSENTIEKAILSVLRQGYENFEHIIYDGGSTDGTIEILKKYPHLTWISEPDKGQCDAMNKAFEKSTGEIIAYLNVDDYFQRGVFQKIAKAFEENPDAEMVVGNLYFEFDDHTFIRKPEIEYKKIMQPFKYIFPINPVSYFYKRSVQTEAGPFPLDNHYTMDYWFLLKAYQNHKIIKIEDYLGTFCMNGFNKTSGADNRKNTHYRVIEHCWKYDRKNLPSYLLSYYKFYYYEKPPYNLTKLYHNLRKNAGRMVSVLTLKKNKYYSEKMLHSSRSNYYMNRRARAFSGLIASFFIYPKGLTHRSRQSMLAYTLLGKNYTEKAKIAYFFFTTPPGLPLANKIHYYSNEFKKSGKTVKGNSLLFLTFIVSPNFIFKQWKSKKSPDKETYFII